MPDKVVNTTAPGGTTLPMTEADANVLGAQVVHPAVAEQQMLSDQRRKMFGGVRDQLTSIAEGIVDAYTGGFIHETGEEADLRRESTPGSVMLGEAIGTIVGMKAGGPIKVLNDVGEKAGKKAAQSFLKQGERTITSRALQEAGAGAIVAGENMLGHQLVDSIIGDHEFSGEAVIDTTKLGGLVGAGAGALMGSVSKLNNHLRTTRADVQMGASASPDDLADAMMAHDAQRHAYAESLGLYEKQLGAMKEYRRVGKLDDVSDNFIDVRSKAVGAARDAQAAVKELDVEHALSGADPAAYRELQKRMARYHKAVGAADDIMRADRAELEAAALRGEAGTGVHSRQVDDLTDVFERATGTHQRVPDAFSDGPASASSVDAVPPASASAKTSAGKRASQSADAPRSRAEPSAAATPEYSAQELYERVRAGLRNGSVSLDEVSFRLSKAREMLDAATDHTSRHHLKRAIDALEMGARDAEALVPQSVEAMGSAGAQSRWRMQDQLPDGNVLPAGANPVDQLAGGAQPVADAMQAMDGRIGQLALRSGADNGAAAANVASSAAPGPGMFAREGTEFGLSGGQGGRVQGAIDDMFSRGRGKKDLIDAAEGAVPTTPYAKLTEDAVPPPTPEEAIRTKGFGRMEPDEVARKLMDDWMTQSSPRTRPWDEAQARAQAIAEGLYKKSGGRFDSAKAIGILEKDGIKVSADPVGAQLDAVYAMNRIARLAADESRGVATPLRDLAKKAMGGSQVGAILRMAGVKHGIMLGILGYAGKLAASSGRMVTRVSKAVESFVTSTKVRAGTIAASNYAWAYSEAGPIEDPIERIREIQFMAGNPEAIKMRVRQAAGDLAGISPNHVMALENKAVVQMQALSMRAPAIYFDRLGRALSPPAGKLRQFFEFENGVNDLGTLLKGIESGSITRPQIEALQVAWPAVHTKLVMGLLADPAKLQTYSRDKLRLVEQMTGMPLTGASDPQFMLRQQMAWQPPVPQGQPANAPQAFNINPDGAPTPSQANATGRAPGN